MFSQTIYFLWDENFLCLEYLGPSIALVSSGQRYAPRRCRLGFAGTKNGRAN